MIISQNSATPAPSHQLADLPVKALSEDLVGSHDLLWVAVESHGLRFQLEYQFIIIAVVVSYHRGQGDVAVGPGSPIPKEVIASLVGIIRKASLQRDSHSPSLKPQGLIVRVDLHLGLTLGAAGVDLCRSFVIPGITALTGQLHPMYIVVLIRNRFP